MILLNLLEKACTSCKKVRPARDFKSPLVQGLTNRCAHCRECNQRGKKKYNRIHRKELSRKHVEYAEKRLEEPVGAQQRRCRRCLKSLPLPEFSISSNGVLFKTCDKCRQWSREYQVMDRARRPEAAHASTERAKSKSRERKLRVLAHYGNKCACCGETHQEFLAMDHEDGNGAEHRRDITLANGIYRWLEKHGYPDGFRVLCFNCNWSYGVYGYCPHQKDKEVLHPVDQLLRATQVSGTVN